MRNTAAKRALTGKELEEAIERTAREVLDEMCRLVLNKRLDDASLDELRSLSDLVHEFWSSQFGTDTMIATHVREWLQKKRGAPPRPACVR